MIDGTCAEGALECGSLLPLSPSQLAGWDLRVVGQFDVDGALRRHLAT
jgi:hypothetical protein